MLLLSPIIISSISPRTTVLYHIPTFSPIVTLPTTCAPRCNKCITHFLSFHKLISLLFILPHHPSLFHIAKNVAYDILCTKHVPVRNIFLSCKCASLVERLFFRRIQFNTLILFFLSLAIHILALAIENLHTFKV